MSESEFIAIGNTYVNVRAIAYAKFVPSSRAVHLYVFGVDGKIRGLRIPPEGADVLLRVLDERSITVDVPRGEDILGLPD